MVKLSAWMAIAVGALLAAAQLYRNYDNLENWMTWTIDIVAGLVMVVAGLLALRKQTTRLLPVGWAFAIGLFASGTFSHLNALRMVEGQLYVAEQRLVMILGALDLVCLVGVALVLFAPRQQTT